MTKVFAAFEQDRVDLPDEIVDKALSENDSFENYQESCIVLLNEKGLAKSPCGNVTVSFTGKITNLDECRSKLNDENIKCDSDILSVVCAAITTWQDAAPEKFEGTFVFAAWFKDQQRLLCARDPMGHENLLIYDNGKQLIISNDLNQLKVFWDSAPPINLAAFHHYLKFGYSSPELHVLEGVDCLAPGSTQWLGLKPERYWPNNIKPDVQIDDVLASTIEQYKRNSKNALLITDECSILIASLLRDDTNTEILHIDYPSDPNNEKQRELTFKVADTFGLKYRIVKVNDEELCTDITEMLSSMFESNGSHKYPLLFSALKKCQGDYDNVIDSFGSQHLMLNLEKYALADKWQKEKKMSFLKQQLSNKDKVRWQKLRFHEKVTDSLEVIDREEIRRLLLDDYNGQWYTHSVTNYLLSDDDTLSKHMQNFDTHSMITGQHNTMMNEITKHFSMHYSNPYQNPNFIKLACLTSDKNDLLKQCVISKLPKNLIANFEHHSYSLNLEILFKAQFKDLLDQYLNTNKVDTDNIFNSFRIEKLVEDSDNSAKGLWSILTFVMWYDSLKDDCHKQQ